MYIYYFGNWFMTLGIGYIVLCLIAYFMQFEKYKGSKLKQKIIESFKDIFIDLSAIHFYLIVLIFSISLGLAQGCVQLAGDQAIIEMNDRRN